MSKVPDLRADATTDQFVLTHVNTGHISVHHLAGVGGPTQDDLTAKYKRAGRLLALGSAWLAELTYRGGAWGGAWGEAGLGMAHPVVWGISYPLVVLCVQSPQGPPWGCFLQAPKPAWFLSSPILLTLRRQPWVHTLVPWAPSRRSRDPSAKQDSVTPLQTFRNDPE